MSTLYRSYRPKSFAEVVGQDHITKPLARAITKGKVAHAYLFHGARGTGKTTTARLIAQGITGKSELDVIEIDAASNRGIDDIRALQEGVVLKPTSGDYKVYIIDEVHMLTKEAFTALLKTLEEPVAHAVFVLATTEFHKVPETIVSRCQVYRFRRATAGQMAERLLTLLKKEKRQIDDKALQFIISRSDGCYRDAESLLGQALSAESGDITLRHLIELLGLPPQELVDQFLEGMTENNAATAIAAIDQVFSGGFDTEQFLQESIRTAREQAITDIKSETADITSLSRLPQIIRALIQASQDIAYVPEPLIALQLAVVTVCVPSTTAKHAVLSAHSVGASQGKPAQLSTSAGHIIGKGRAMGSAELAVVKAAWPKLIDVIRKDSPVASTFLRAMAPTAVEEGEVYVMAHYALHRNFFEKNENREPLEHALSKLLKTKVDVRVAFDGVNGANQAKIKKAQQENDLLQTVKEVFGENLKQPT